MSETNDSRDILADQLRADMPPVPSQDSLVSVRSAAKRRAAHIHGQRRRSARGWRAAGAVLAAAAVIAVGAFALAPRLENAAFARDRAADALVLKSDGRITHMVTRFTETGWTEQFGHDARYDLNQRTESWYDPANTRSYSKIVNLGDGSLDMVTVRNGDRELTFANNVRYGTGDKPGLIEGNVAGTPLGTQVGFITDYTRKAIIDGDAKVDGTKMVDGEECWVVIIDENKLAEKYAQPGDPEIDSRGFSIVTVTLRKSDYLVKTWARDGVGYNGNGKTTTTQRAYIDSWDYVDPSTVDSATFSIDEVIKLAPKGTKLTATRSRTSSAPSATCDRSNVHSTKPPPFGGRVSGDAATRATRTAGGPVGRTARLRSPLGSR